MAEMGPYFGDTMTIAAETSDATSIPIGSTQSVEIRVEVEETEYFSADTTLREAVRHTEKVPIVSATVGAWDIELHKQWLGGDGTSSTGLVDTSNPQKFKLTGTITPTDGSTSWDVEVTGVTFATLPFFSASRNEFIGLEIEGRGDDIDITQEPA